MGDILRDYDILGAFWVTIQLSALSAIGSLLLGTFMAVLRVSPVAVLRLIGTSYVNIVRNTPLTLLMVSSVLGISLATVVFAILNAAVLRPLAVASP